MVKSGFCESILWLKAYLGIVANGSRDPTQERVNNKDLWLRSATIPKYSPSTRKASINQCLIDGVNHTWMWVAFPGPMLFPIAKVSKRRLAATRQRRPARRLF
jgi:hypothetical protein